MAKNPSELVTTQAEGGGMGNFNNKEDEMKIQVDISDFYLDSENGEDVEKSLKEYIVNTVTQNIWKSINKKVEDQIERTVTIAIQQSLALKINAEVSRLIATENIINPRDRKTEISILDYIKTQFQNDSGWGTPKDLIGQIAKKFGDELKARYDTAFATQIVVQLGKNQMLREGADKLLLTEQK